MKIAIVTDSTCDLAEEFFAERNNLDFVPLKVQFGEESFYDRVDISSREFFAKLNVDSRHPSTSQPSMGDFLEKYQELSQEFDHIISIHISGELSGTIESAQLAARQLEDIGITIVDSKSATLGLGFLVKLADKLVAEEREIAEVEEILTKARENLEVYFTVSDLSFLQKGGRIGKAQAFLGSILNFHPLLGLSGARGVIEPIEKVRGRKKMKTKMEEIFQDKVTDEKIAWLGMMHGDAKKRMLELKDVLIKVGKAKNLNLSTEETIISPVLGCHVGPSVYGFALLTGDFLE